MTVRSVVVAGRKKFLTTTTVLGKARVAVGKGTRTRVRVTLTRSVASKISRMHPLKVEAVVMLKGGHAVKHPLVLV